MARRYYTTKSQSGPWDVIVIGSGMGGQTTANLLARLGKRVLVLDQHYVPGGFTHAFTRKKWSWDVGVHAIGDTSEKSFVGRFLHLMTDGQLRWQSLGSVYDEFHFPGGFSIGFPNNRAAFREALVEAFPHDAQAIDEYLMLVREVAGGMRSWLLGRVLPRWAYPASRHLLGRATERAFHQTTEQVLSGLTNNRKLQAVLTSQWGYYGSQPAESAFGAQALVARHFFYGAAYPVGGSERIAETMLAPVLRAGGSMRIKASVERVVLEGGKAVGVQLAGGEQIRAPLVVSAVGAVNTIRHLLPDDVQQQPWARSVNALAPSPAHLCLYLGFTGNIREAGASPTNQWLYETWDRVDDDWPRLGDDQPVPVLYVSFPSLKDPEHDPGSDQLHTGEIVTFIKPEEFQRWENTRWMKRGEDYEALKQSLTDRMLAQLERVMPGLIPLIAHAELSTPLSTKHFDRSYGAAIYGLESTPRRFSNKWLRPRIPVKNLLLSGVDVGLPGVIGAMIGGVVAAAAAEPRVAKLFFQAVRGAGPATT